MTQYVLKLHTATATQCRVHSELNKRSIAHHDAGVRVVIVCRMHRIESLLSCGVPKVCSQQPTGSNQPHIHSQQTPTTRIQSTDIVMGLNTIISASTDQHLLALALPLALQCLAPLPRACDMPHKYPSLLLLFVFSPLLSAMCLSLLALYLSTSALSARILTVCSSLPP